jgi:hypothetical protein
MIKCTAVQSHEQQYIGEIGTKLKRVLPSFSLTQLPFSSTVNQHVEIQRGRCRKKVVSIPMVALSENRKRLAVYLRPSDIRK